MSPFFAEKTSKDPQAFFTTKLSFFRILAEILAEILYLVYEELICLPHTLIIVYKAINLVS